MKENSGMKSYFLLGKNCLKITILNCLFFFFLVFLYIYIAESLFKKSKNVDFLIKSKNLWNRKNKTYVQRQMNIHLKLKILKQIMGVLETLDELYIYL